MPLLEVAAMVLLVDLRATQDSLERTDDRWQLLVGRLVADGFEVVRHHSGHRPARPPGALLGQVSSSSSLSVSFEAMAAS